MNTTKLWRLKKLYRYINSVFVLYIYIIINRTCRWQHKTETGQQLYRLSLLIIFTPRRRPLGHRVKNIYVFFLCWERNDKFCLLLLYSHVYKRVYNTLLICSRNVKRQVRNLLALCWIYILAAVTKCHKN